MLKAQQGVTDLDLITVYQHAFGDALAVHHAAVGRAQILHLVAVSQQVDLDVSSRDCNVRNDQHLIRAATHGGHGAV